jgi:hypothetical protein
MRQPKRVFAFDTIEGFYAEIACIRDGRNISLTPFPLAWRSETSRCLTGALGSETRQLMLFIR